MLAGSWLNTSRFCAQVGQEEMPHIAPWEHRLAMRKNSPLKTLSSTGTGCPGKVSLEYLKSKWMWCLGMCFDNGLGSAGRMVGFNDPN